MVGWWGTWWGGGVDRTYRWSAERRDGRRENEALDGLGEHGLVDHRDRGLEVVAVVEPTDIVREALGGVGGQVVDVVEGAVLLEQLCDGVGVFQVDLRSGGFVGLIGGLVAYPLVGCMVVVGGLVGWLVTGVGLAGYVGRGSWAGGPLGTHVHERCRLWNIAEEATAQIIDRNGLKTELVGAVVSHMRGDEASSTRHEHARLLAVVEGDMALADLCGDVGERPRLSVPPVVSLCRAIVPSCRSKVRASRSPQAPSARRYGYGNHEVWSK